jgi:hypothetical protein
MASFGFAQRVWRNRTSTMTEHRASVGPAVVADGRHATRLLIICPSAVCDLPRARRQLGGGAGGVAKRVGDDQAVELVQIR